MKEDILCISVMHKIDQTLAIYKKKFFTEANIQEVNNINDIPRKFHRIVTFTPIDGTYDCDFEKLDYTNVRWVNDLDVHIGQKVRLHEAPLCSFLECIRRSTKSEVYFMRIANSTEVFMSV